MATLAIFLALALIVACVIIYILYNDAVYFEDRYFTVSDMYWKEKRLHDNAKDQMEVYKETVNELLKED